MFILCAYLLFKNSLKLLKPTFSLRSPFLKCFGLTLKSSARLVVSSPSSCFSCVAGSSAGGGAGSPLMYQARRVAGRDRPDEQFTWTRSPIWYRRRDPVIVGPWSGSARDKITFQFILVTIRCYQNKIIDNFLVDFIFPFCISK